MLRVAIAFLLSAVVWLGLTAFWVADPKFDDGSFAVNSTVAHFFDQSRRSAPLSDLSQPSDSSAFFRILMLNYSAYDSAYAAKMRGSVQRQFPSAEVVEFWEGTADELAALLSNQQVVVISYPSRGENEALHAYGEVLGHFVRQGGAVILTGTHEFGILQQFDLFDLDFGYFCKDPDVHEDLASHPVMAGTPEDFRLAEYAYPLDVSDPGFITLADIKGYPVMGYKPEGLGKVVYLGFEYYYEEPVSTRLLANAIRWASPPPSETNVQAAKTNVSSTPPPLAVRRTEEFLTAGGGKNTEAPGVKIYPNPYTVKATLEFELSKATPVAIEMTDELGRRAAELLKQRTLVAGTYYFELPNVPPGIYFVKCQYGEHTTVRKVVKLAEQ